MIAIVGAPGGGTSFFTKFLRYNGFYAGKSIEEGRDNKDHIGYLYNRKWHESIVYSDFFCKAILNQMGVGEEGYRMLFSGDYKMLINEVNERTKLSLDTFIEDNSEVLVRMYEDEFPDSSVPHGFKNPRSFLLIPFIKKAYPNIKILTVQRSMNPNPSSQGPEGKAFTARVNDKDYIEAVYGHKDDFRFQFENFIDIDKVNSLLRFVGLKELSNNELNQQLKKLDFNVSKIGK